ncbi:hypothetical protein SUDANB95_03150 [Actinosynnema sp. ALI-1.44]
MITSSGRSNARSMLVLLAVSVLALAGALTAVATTGNATNVAVEDDGADCPVSLPGSLTSNAKLPDPFKRLNGTRVTSQADWRCHRAQTRELAERYVYGDKPGKPTSVTGSVSGSGISVNVSHNGRTASFSARVELPGGTGPFPAVVVVGGLGADTATIKAAGAAVIDYDPLAVGREGTPRTDKQGAFYTIYGSSSTTGLLAAWAWGVSRIIDVVEQSGGTILKADATGVTGCSRYGKAAFAIGAFDQRIALTMPVESGSAGVPAFRAIAGESGAQPLSSAYGEQPWLGDAFSPFTGSPATLPIDTHQVVGMIAPRGLFIMENPHVDWLGARSGSVAALAGAEVYRALGVGSNISYWSDVQDGTHCASRSEWRAPLRQNIQKFLLKTGGTTGTFRISSRKAGSLTEWKDWQTPTLTDGTTTTTATTTTTPPPGGCSATVSVNQWTGGFVATVRVTAGSAPITGWAVTASLPPGASVTNAWNSNRSGNSGTVEFTNVSFNGSLGAGQSTEFGFQGTGTGTGLAATCAVR